MASPTAAPGQYPKQVVIMVTTTAHAKMKAMAVKHRLSMSEVARTLIETGIEQAEAAAAEQEAQAAADKAAALT